jgi:hypothetical protein
MSATDTPCNDNRLNVTDMLLRVIIVAAAVIIIIIINVIIIILQRYVLRTPTLHHQTF